MLFFGFLMTYKAVPNSLLTQWQAKFRLSKLSKSSHKVQK